LGLKLSHTRVYEPQIRASFAAWLKSPSSTIRYSLSVLVTSKRSSDFLLCKRSEQLFRRMAEIALQYASQLGKNVKRFRGVLVFKAHRLSYHSTLGWRVIKKKKTLPKIPLGLRCSVLGVDLQRSNSCFCSLLIQEPCTLNPQLTTLHPKPYTLNPKPETFNPGT